MKLILNRVLTFLLMAEWIILTRFYYLGQFENQIGVGLICWRHPRANKIVVWTSFWRRKENQEGKPIIGVNLAISILPISAGTAERFNRFWKPADYKGQWVESRTH